MALFQLTPTHRTSEGVFKPYTTLELLNTKKVGNFRNENNVLIFEYFEKEDGRQSKVEYKADLTHNEFHALLREPDNERWLYAHALAIKPATGAERNFDQDIWIDTDRLVRAWEVVEGGKTRLWVEVDEGAFTITTYKLANDLSAFDEAGSQSTSLSFSL